MGDGIMTMGPVASVPGTMPVLDFSGGAGEVLERNLAALGRTSGETAARVRAAAPSWDAEFHGCDDGLVGVSVGARALCSRRRPAAEGESIASQIDVAQTATVIVMGFGAGHHVAALARRMRKTGVIVVFEPDVPLLRAVLERIDHSDWLRESNVAILTEAEDGGAMSQVVRGVEGLFMMGLEILEHPPSAERLGERKTRFYENFQQVVGAVRTQVATTMVLVKATLRNLLMNIGAYAACEGIADLKGTAAGRLGIVVSAGPSLERNIDQLGQPWVRERCVIVAAQTVLKTLLKRGIRPHFVTALDHAEISARFYEGLSAADVDGTTLVVEPKANPAILEAFPGRIRCVAHEFLDSVLGERLTRERGSLTPGATVAHLAYYLARYMGCDPVALVGQDLGFTDGQYYGAGAAIHDVWACELNEFNTLEMMEWQRIKRMGSHLKRVKDVLLRPVYTDEQMTTYLVQFERDFRADVERGLTIIDATEGGVAKAHTVREPLGAVLARQRERGAMAGWHCSPGSDGAAVARAPNRNEGSHTTAAPRGRGEPWHAHSDVSRRLRAVRAGVWKVEQLSREASSALVEMQERCEDRARVDRLIGRVNDMAREVEAIDPAYRLVHYLNKTGAFNRLKADRGIQLDESLSALERQRKRIERDRVNVDGLADAAKTLGEMLDASVRRLAGDRKRARAGSRSAPERRAPRGSASERPCIRAVMYVDSRTSALGLARDLSRPIAGDGGRAGARSVLRLTLERLSGCRGLDGALLLTEDVDEARRLAGPAIPGLPVTVVPIPPGSSRRPAWLRAARLWSRDCWRGGIGGATCYDEAILAGPMGAAMREHGVDASLVVGADWCLVDPALCDATIERFVEQGAVARIALTQAPPGLCGCVIGRGLMEEMARLQGTAGGGGPARGSLGQLLSYVPGAPVMDLIGSTPCAPIEPRVRDSARRFIVDSDTALARIGVLIESVGTEATASRLVECTEESAEGQAFPAPECITLEITTASRTRPHWLGNTPATTVRHLSPDDARQLLTELVGSRAGVALTLAGRGDPLLHPEFGAIVRAARDAGVAGVHVRTDLACETSELESLPWRELDVISVNLMALTAQTYRRLIGVDLLERVRANVERLIRLRAEGGGGAETPWIVPRLTRCDETYGEIEGFFDRWLVAAGAAVIDSLPAEVRGERIGPLPLPDSARRRFERSDVFVDVDGCVTRGRAPRSE